ncbi:Tetratricopeptide repeat protein 4 [Halotydeus destructor]|nr:Tetratricopeptide repeat protein 4 [Halotydeus destructor]
MDTGDEEIVIPEDHHPGRYPGGWNEETWEKEFEKDPIFMTKAPETGELPPMLEALQQLKYDKDANSADELASNYKKDGNENFRLKKYRWAIDAYTEGLKLNCPDKTIMAQLYGNRAASHFFLQNYRRSLEDCFSALTLTPSNEKCAVRVAQIYVIRGEYDKCITFVEHYPENSEKLEKVRQEAVEKLPLQKAKEAKEKAAALEQQQLEKSRDKILDVIKERGIRIKQRDFVFMSPHPGAFHCSVTLNANNELEWPVIFVYPEYGQTDFIENFNENNTFMDHLKMMFSDENRPGWDVEKKFNPENLTLGFALYGMTDLVKLRPELIYERTSSQTDFEKDFVCVRKDMKLRDAMRHPQFCLLSANPMFLIGVRQTN